MWSATNPQFTHCFMQTTFVWGPAIFLAFFALFDIYLRFKSRYSDIPWSLLNISKYLLIIILFALSITDLVIMLNARSNGEIIYDVQVVTSSVKIATFVSNFLRKFKQKSIKSSQIVFSRITSTFPQSEGSSNIRIAFLVLVFPCRWRYF
jgi:hypothetical protein